PNGERVRRRVGAPGARRRPAGPEGAVQVAVRVVVGEGEVSTGGPGGDDAPVGLDRDRLRDARGAERSRDPAAGAERRVGGAVRVESPEGEVAARGAGEDDLAVGPDGDRAGAADGGEHFS